MSGPERRRDESGENTSPDGRKGAPGSHPHADADDTVVGSGSSRREPRALVQGDLVGRYVVVGRLGAGAMGVVHLAYDPELDRRVALKLLRSRRDGSEGADDRTRLLREAQAMARLSHPNVVTVHDVGEHEGAVFLAMEFVEGRTLKAWLDGERQSWPEILDVLVKAGLGLAAAHRAGLVHRDFKPDNVMVTLAGARIERVVVMDFGLARPDREATESSGKHAQPSAPRMAALAEDLTVDGAIVGTPAYMPVEQLAGQKTDARADQFAFCVTLHEALYRRRPFAGTDLAGLAGAIIDGRILPPPADTRVPRRIQRVIERGLRSDPHERFGSMEELLAALERVPARRLGAWIAAGVAVAIAGGAWGIVAWSQERTRAECHARGEAIASVWNESTAQPIANAFAELDAPWALHAWQLNEERLDSYAARWAAAAERVCLDAQLHGTTTVEVERAAERCLDDARARVDALVEQVAAPDLVVAAASVVSVAGLDPVEVCLDADSVTRSHPSEVDGPGVERFRRERQRVVVMLTLRPGEAREAAEAVVREARELGLHALALEAEVDAAFAAINLPDYAAAEREVWHAYLAATALGRDDIALRALSMHVYVVGYLLSRPDEGMRNVELANALVERLSLQGSLEEAELLTAAAAVYSLAGRLTEARAMLERALEIRRRFFGAQHPAVGEAQAELATILAQLGSETEARAAHAEGLAADREAYGPDHPGITARLNSIAYTYMRFGKYEEARPYVNEALARYRADGSDESVLAGILINLGAVERHTGRPEEALDHYQEALEIFRRVTTENSGQVGEILTDIGIVYDDLGDYERALEYHRRAADALEGALGAENPRTVTALMNQSTALSELDRPEEARAVLETVIERAARHEAMDAVHGVALLNLVHLYSAAGDHERALSLAEESLRLKEKAFGADHPSVAVTLLSLAMELRAVGRDEHVRPHLERALKIIEANGSPRDRGSVRFELAEVLGDEPRARTLAEQARADFVSAGASAVDRVAEVDAWLAAHAQ